MSSRKTIYLTAEALEAIGPIDDDESLSGRIATTLIRYDHIRLDVCPELTEKEWLAICDANNSSWLQAEAGENDPARFAWMNVADAEELDDKWAVDRLDLARRMKAMPYPEQCSIIEVIARFWKNSSHQEGVTYAELLRQAGAKIEE